MQNVTSSSYSATSWCRIGLRWFEASRRDLATVSQVGLAFDGVTIFCDAPSVGDAGGLPALDACGVHISETAQFGETYHYHLSTDSPNLPTCRVGATANDNLTSPDGAGISLPGSGDGGGGPAGGPPPGEEPGQG